MREKTKDGLLFWDQKEELWSIFEAYPEAAWMIATAIREGRFGGNGISPLRFYPEPHRLEASIDDPVTGKAYLWRWINREYSEPSNTVCWETHVGVMVNGEMAEVGKEVVGWCEEWIALHPDEDRAPDLKCRIDMRAIVGIY